MKKILTIFLVMMLVMVAGVSAATLNVNPMGVAKDDNTNFGSSDNEAVGFDYTGQGLTLNQLFAGDGFQYKYTVLNGGSYNGASPAIAVIDLSDGRHIILFPGWGTRTGTHTLTFSDTSAIATANSGNVPVDFEVRDSNMIKLWSSNSQYGNWNYLKASGSSTGGALPLIGDEVVTRVAIQHQAANTGEEDRIDSMLINGVTYYGTIQGAIDAASAGDTINVAAGTYAEQLEITKDLTIVGLGDKNVIIQSPDILTKYFTTSSANKPIIYVHDTANVVIDNVVVDGLGKGNANNRFIGIAFRSAGGSVLNSEIKNIQDTPFSGAQHGVAIYAWNDVSPERYLTVKGNYIYDYQKNGMALNGEYTTVTVEDNTVIGKGTTGVTAQNGIQLGWAATGTVKNNDVEGNNYNCNKAECDSNEINGNEDGWEAAGILLYETSGNVVVSGNKVFNNGMGISADNPLVIINNNQIVGNDVFYGGINWYSTGTLNAENNWWGCNEGPGNPGCDKAIVDPDTSTGVIDYTPWIIQSGGDVTTEPNTPIVVDTTGTNTGITITTLTGQSGTVTVQQYSSNPQTNTGLISIPGLNVYVDITTDISDISAVEVKIYYNEDDLGGKSELSLVPYWWNPETNEWEAITPYGINRDENYVYFTVTHLSLFTIGGSEGNVGGEGGDFVALEVPDFIDYGTLYGNLGYQSPEKTIVLNNAGSLNIAVTPVFDSGHNVFKYIKFSDTSGSSYGKVQNGIGIESDYSTTIDANLVSSEPLQFSNTKPVYTRVILSNDLRPLKGVLSGTIYFQAVDITPV